MFCGWTVWRDWGGDVFKAVSALISAAGRSCSQPVEHYCAVVDRGEMFSRLFTV